MHFEQSQIYATASLPLNPNSLQTLLKQATSQQVVLYLIHIMIVLFTNGSQSITLRNHDLVAPCRNMRLSISAEAGIQERHLQATPVLSGSSRQLLLYSLVVIFIPWDGRSMKEVSANFQLLKHSYSFSHSNIFLK